MKLSRCQHIALDFLSGLDGFCRGSRLAEIAEASKRNGPQKLIESLYKKGWITPSTAYTMVTPWNRAEWHITTAGVDALHKDVGRFCKETWRR